jgi:import receptor subunit TOM70
MCSTCVAFSGLGIWYYRSRKNEIQPSDKEDKQSKKNVADVAASVAVTDELQPTKKVNGIDKNTAKSADAVVVEEDPNKQAQVYKNKGNEYFKEGKYSDAIKCYQQAIDICPKDNTDVSLFHQNRAAAFEQLVPSSCHSSSISIKTNSCLHRKTTKLSLKTARKLSSTIQSMSKLCTEEQRPMK